MAAHFLAKNGEGPYAYGVNMVFSSNGTNWSDPTIPHETVTQTEHGFLSLLPYKDGFFGAWLDGRNTGGAHGHGEGAMSLRGAFLDNKGNVKEEFELDDRICDCCQTTAVITENGPVVAYRDRSEDEIRDMSVVRWTGTEWTEPMTINADNWFIPGCPVNGPVLASNGDKLAAAWFTSPEQQSKINLSFSDDGGASFSEPMKIDLGNPIGRVDMIMLENNEVFVSWMEANRNDATIIVGRFNAQGAVEEPFVLAKNKSERASGFPRMTLAGDHILFAWRDLLGESSVRTARIKI